MRLDKKTKLDNRSKDNSTFIPELWSDSVVITYKQILDHFGPGRSRGERLLRAAAQGASQEEIDKIDMHGRLSDLLSMEGTSLVDIQRVITDHAADAMKYSIDQEIWKNFVKEQILCKQD